MPKKSAKTSQFIIEKTAPIFNMHGYNGTSMSDLTKATGLTKGAIYGNFKNKEELSILVFNYNIKNTIGKLGKELLLTDSPISKLYCITNFYRRYYKSMSKHGGCPIINMGIDTNNKNGAISKRVRSVIAKLEKNIELFIQEGIDKNEIKEDINPSSYASLIFSMLEGSILMYTILKDPKYTTITANQIDKIIRTELSI